MSWRNVKTLLDAGYKNQVHARRKVAVEQQKLSLQSKSLIWVHIDRL